MRYWLLAVRPKTLSLAVVPVLVGTAWAWRDAGAIQWTALLATLLGALLIQIGTNLHNDAADFARGTDAPATRLGPPRATAEGWLGVAEVRRAAWLSFAVAGLLGLYLVWLGGWPILAVGLVSILAAVAYSGGPLPLSHTPLGELFVWLFFGVVAVAATYYLQTARLSSAALATGAILGLPAAAVLMVNNHRDRDGDRAAGRRTLAVCLGDRGSRLVYAWLMLAPFPALAALPGTSPASWMLPVLSLPWGLWLVTRLFRGAAGAALNRLLAATAGFQLGLGLLLAAALVWR